MPSKPGPTTKEIRAWALRDGRNVSNRGPISAKIVQEFQRAHATETASKQAPKRQTAKPRSRATVGGKWIPLMTDPVNVPPGPGSPSMRPKGDDLDLRIGWERFEKLVLAVSRNLLGIESIELRRFGTVGQKQYGIDIAGREPDGRYSVVQCKDYQSLTPARLRTAINKFANERASLPFVPYQFVIATSFPGDPKQLYSEIAIQQKKYPDLKLSLWGSETINEALLTRADIVARFWTTETAENFCTVPVTGVPAPAPDRAAQADHVLVGPLSTIDFASRIRDAHAESTGPSTAAAIFDSVAAELEHMKFRAYAFSIRDDQIDALVRANAIEEASALAARLATISLYHSDLESADRLSRRLQKLTGEDIVSQVKGLPRTNSAVARLHSLLIRSAVDAVQDPLGDTEELVASLRSQRAKGHVPDYQPVLVLLAAESVLADEPGRLAELGDLVGEATVRIATHPFGDLPDDIAIRLRLIQSEYNECERESLVRAANTFAIPKRHAALVKAREARRNALSAAVSSARDYWRSAINDGIHDDLAEDAASWLFAIRRLRAAYGPWIFGPDEEFRSAQALRLTPGDRLLPRYSNARELALTEVVAKRANSAIVATRRWLTDSIVAAHWADEAQALELLADLYAENSEPNRAALYYQRSGGTKKLTSLIEKIGDQRLDAGPVPDAPAPWWELRARTLILSQQSDLLDDITAATRLDEAIELARRGRSGELTEDPQRTLTLEVTKCACALAARGTMEQATAVLHMLQSDVKRQPNHFRHSDPAHAKACVAIATTHPGLAYAALKRLLDLADNDTYDALVELNQSVVLVMLGADQYDRPIGVPKRVSPLTTAQRRRLKNRVRHLVQAGRYLAADVLQRLDPASPDLRPSAEVARDRILSRPAPDPNSADSGIGLASNAALVRALGTDDQKACLTRLLVVAHDAGETAENRRESLIGAGLLVKNQPRELKEGIFLSCRDFVDGGEDGSAFDELAGTPHPLSTFKVDLGPSSLRSAGLTLALAAATRNDQYQWILNEAFVLFRSSDVSDVSTAAHIVNRLPHAITDSIPSAVISGISGSPNAHVRQLAAVLSIRSSNANEALALQLARDDIPSVRRTLASALAVAEHSETTDRIMAVVQKDARHSVRVRLNT